MQKKGQITAFIIVGVVILILGFIIIYMAFIDSEPSVSQTEAGNENIERTYLYLEQCLGSITKDAVKSLADNNELIEQYIKIRAGGCFEESPFTAVEIEIDLPLELIIEKRIDHYFVDYIINTRISEGDSIKEVNRYSFNIPLDASATISNESASVNVEGEEVFVMPTNQPASTEQFVQGEVIVHYNYVPEEEALEEYVIALEELHIISREFVYDEELLNTPGFEGMEDIIADLYLDERIIFDENKVSYEDLKNILISFEFVGEVTRNKLSYTEQAMQKTSLLNRPNDRLYAYQWYLENWGQFFGVPGADIKIRGAWDITKGDNSVLIAVIDEGVYPHYDIYENMLHHRSFNLIENNANTNPKTAGEYHGTHVAGLIVSELDNNLGIAGVCPKCRMINLKVLDEYNGVDSTTLIKAVLMSVGNGAKIVSMSLGGPYYSSYEERTFKSLSQKGIVFIAAAGNDGTSQKMYPAAYEGVIAVGASDNTDRVSSFSNYGPWVDIIAPGELILSTCPKNRYCFSSGTSMAAPLVSGVAGLIKSVKPTLSAAGIEQAIKQTADQINGEYKRINAEEVLKLVAGVQPTTITEQDEISYSTTQGRDTTARPIDYGRDRIKSSRQYSTVTENKEPEVDPGELIIQRIYAVIQKAERFSDAITYCRYNPEECEQFCSLVNQSSALCQAINE